MISLLLTFLLVLLATLYVKGLRQRRKGFPPGPMGIPVLGYAPFLGDNPGKTFSDLSPKYGPIFSVNLGFDTWVILNDYNSVHKALVKKSDIFSGRPKIHTFEKISQGQGLVFLNECELWRNQRKFGARSFKRFGYGKSNTEGMIVEEIGYLCDAISEKDGKPFHCQGPVSNAIANIVLRRLLGHRLCYNDKTFIHLVKISGERITDRLDGALFGIMTFLPMARFLPVFWGSYNRFYARIDGLNEFLQGYIDEHKKSFNADNVRDFIDEFLLEIDQGRDKEHFSERQLLHYLHEMFTAGMETTASTLRWCIFALVHFQEVQGRIWKEVEATIGENGIPSMKHQDAMPYTCAFIHEIMRHRTLVPLNLPHMTTDHVVLEGHVIPINTPIMPNLWAVHNDPKYFKDPEQFRPERFIDQKGSFVPSSHVIPFSVGPRACLGEQLARMEVFLFVVGILQKFKIVPDQEKPLPSFTDGVFGVVYGPYEFNAKFLQR